VIGIGCILLDSVSQVTAVERVTEFGQGLAVIAFFALLVRTLLQNNFFAYLIAAIILAFVPAQLELLRQATTMFRIQGMLGLVTISLVAIGLRLIFDKASRTESALSA